MWALAAALATGLAAPASAQYIDGAPPPRPIAPIGREAPADALARYVRILAQSPRDYSALVGAGRAALATGDSQAAFGLFSRAAEIWPAAPAPKAGLGAALAAMGDAARALPLFDQAQRAGATLVSFAADRGLARDLLGEQALAQADYRLALSGPDVLEARRRLALSLAISGDRNGALAALTPLTADPATNRTRAFVLALGGDTDSAERLLSLTMPGMARQLDPFLRRLVSLSPAQKAGAVHLGIMPGVGGTQQYAAAPMSRPSAPPIVYGPPPLSGSRLADIDALLRAGQPASASKVASTTIPSPTAPSSAARAATSAAPATSPKRFWVQLASGPDVTSLGPQFARIARREPDLFKGISPFVTELQGRARLLVGPFRSSEDSATFIENLSDAHIDAFGWTSPEGQPVRKIITP